MRTPPAALRATVPPIAARSEASPSPPPSELARRAEALGIPWERLLREEIRTEEKLRGFLADIDADCPLWSILAVLSFSFLQSWRARDRIGNLAHEARSCLHSDALRELRSVFRRLTGAGPGDRAAFAEHLWFAYQRVLLLQRVSRVVSRSRRMANAERLAFVCSRARCSFDDAAWAISQEEISRRGHPLDAAVRKVREEGYQIPRLGTEVKSFAELRRIIRSSPRLAGRRSSSQRPRNPVSVPPRVACPVDAV